MSANKSDKDVMASWLDAVLMDILRVHHHEDCHCGYDMCQCAFRVNKPYERDHAKSRSRISPAADVNKCSK